MSKISTPVTTGLSNSMSFPIEVFVRVIGLEAKGILLFELRPVNGKPLPVFTAGAHIELQLPGQLIRSYSLLNSQEERHRYVIAVQLDANSRGGSRAMHALQLGQRLVIVDLRNNFALTESTSHTVLVAGGIGITPLWSMVLRLQALGRPWELFYAARTCAQMALLEHIEALPPSARANVHLFPADEANDRRLDLESLPGKYPPGTHFYCCGPSRMLDMFQHACVELPSNCVHVEHFSNSQEVATEGGFSLKLARQDKCLTVPPGHSVLQVLLAAGIDIPHSCLEGICGSCEVGVLAGQPDHRDLVLSADEQARNTRMMTCCSGSKSTTLVLDL